jgi:hypothetical protein
MPEFYQFWVFRSLSSNSVSSDAVTGCQPGFHRRRQRPFIPLAAVFLVHFDPLFVANIAKWAAWEGGQAAPIRWFPASYPRYG